MASTVEIVGVLHVLSGRCGLNARQRKRCVCRPLPQPETRCRAMARQTVAGRDRRGAVTGSVDHGCRGLSGPNWHSCADGHCLARFVRCGAPNARALAQ